MLNPGKRSLYTEAFKPPSGMVFDKAIGACFSMDPEFLLQVPLNLSLTTGSRENGSIDRVPLLKSIRELSDRITIYVQRGQMHVPKKPNMLFGLLDRMIVQADAPNGGDFHPKFWILRFHGSTESDNVLIRLLVLSRNLTSDRSWDVALTLEGKPTGESMEYNEELHELVSGLLGLVRNRFDSLEVEADFAKQLAMEVSTVEWVLPDGFHGINFHAIGLKESTWARSLPPSEKLAVISPFCKGSALEEFIARTSDPVALVSRPETFLINENQAAYEKFGTLWEIDENCESESGEDNSERPQWDTSGLHAKVYAMEIGGNTHIFLGSANATNAALLNSGNVELMVELVGKRDGRDRIGGIEELFGENGFGNVLRKFENQGIEADANQEEAGKREEALECLKAARRTISNSELKIRCERIGGSDQYNLQLQGALKPLEGISSAHAWLITVEETGSVARKNSVDLFDLTESDSFENDSFESDSFGNDSLGFDQVGSSQVSGLLALDLPAEAFDTGIRFALNLPVHDLPEVRDSKILQEADSSK